jgi:hypothetical protein
MNSTNITIEMGDSPNNWNVQFLFAFIPAMFGPIFGLCTWFVRGHYEKQSRGLVQHNYEKKKYIINHISKQINDFYWPLHLQLMRYKQLATKYKDFKEGHFSLSDGDKNSPPQLKKSNYSTDNVSEKQAIEMNEINEPTGPNEMKPHSYDDNVSLNSTRSMSKDIETESDSLGYKNNKKGLGLKNAIRIINQFNQAITEYQRKIMETLKEAQKIYTQYAPIAEPDRVFLDGLMELDKYITYMSTFAELSEKNDESSGDLIFEKKMESAQFPDTIFDIIESKLKNAQSIYNDLVYNHNSSILNYGKNPAHPESVESTNSDSDEMMDASDNV